MANDFDEIDDIEFNELLADRRHKELVNALKGIASLLNNSSQETLAVSIEKHILAIEKLANKTTEVKVDAPKVEVSQDKVVASIEKLSNELLAELKKYNERPLVDKFELERDFHNNTKAVKVIYHKNINQA